MTATKRLRCRHLKIDGTRCGHTWIPRRTDEKPVVCPKCKNYDWEKGRDPK